MLMPHVRSRLLYGVALTSVCVYVCMCVCVRERERERERADIVQYSAVSRAPDMSRYAGNYVEVGDQVNRSAKWPPVSCMGGWERGAVCIINTMRAA